MFLSVVTLVRVCLTALAAILVGMAVSAWNRRRLAPEAPVFALVMLSAAIYCFGYAGEVAQTTLSGAIFWLHVEYFGIPWISAFWLIGALKQNGLHIRYVLLFIIPVVAFAAELSNSLHGLFDRSMRLVPRSPFWVVSADRGPIAWLNLTYLIFALVYGAWIYISRSPGRGRSRTQTWIMVCSSLAPLAGYFVYLFGYSPWGLDLAPSMLGVTVVLGYIAVFRYGCFDLVPTAHTLVFSSIRDAVLVTDLEQRLVDFNPAARALLPSLSAARPGDALARVFRQSPALVKALGSQAETTRIDVSSGGQDQHFDVHVFPLMREKRQVGSAMILADITEQVRMVRELRLCAETDALTGVGNRRSFMRAIGREYSRSIRHGEPFSIALIDVDHFKSINDQLGHQGGDSVLLTVAERIDRCLRASDLLSRYGGDEFVLLLPRTTRDGALKVAERILAVVAQTPAEVDGQSITTTVSIGIAVSDSRERAGWQAVLKQADRALYQAKGQGRNKVVAWSGAVPAVERAEAFLQGKRH